MSHAEPFRFFTERRLVELTGRRARTAPELLRHLEEVSGASVFFHTHRALRSHHVPPPVVYNDFAIWVEEALQEDALAEKLAAVDLLRFTSVRELRGALVAVLQQHLAKARGVPRECPPGEEFHFCRSKSFVMSTGMVAADVREFFALLERVSNVSLYFHLLEARLRLGRPTNDFSQWLQDRGEPGLARRIDAINPYTQSLDEVKDSILRLGQEGGWR